MVDEPLLRQYLAQIDRRLERIENALVGHKLKLAGLSGTTALLVSFAVATIWR